MDAPLRQRHDEVVREQPQPDEEEGPAEQAADEPQGGSNRGEKGGLDGNLSEDSQARNVARGRLADRDRRRRAA
jgi:hypothetical protein